eukprot:CAMPEP_0115860134 /NCGR_PEP_ID=MMETSP0287-20121206/16969_1 /TAXON_ID=412157 /ORGANISM="Chrysochromulina rotalis, Strain UIO044" /LENGTH=97 /DNA_ID=CAMNT_0003314445 /DNA_START=350 /DNA_END=640 /DNA_ORIENTATION=-
MSTRVESIGQRGCNARERALQLGEDVQVSVPTTPVKVSVLQRAQQSASAHPAPCEPGAPNGAHLHWSLISGHGSTLNALDSDDETGIAALAAMCCVP